MKLYVTYVINSNFPNGTPQVRSRNINWNGHWRWTSTNIAKVRRAISNARLNASQIVIQDVKELEE